MAKGMCVAKAVLEIENLCFGYEEKEPLYENFHLSVHKGEIVAILGPSGSGKTTLFELISGSLKPWSGSIFSKKFSQIFQDPYTSFHPSYSLLGQIKEVASIEDYLSLCKSMELEPSLLKRKPHELSGGQLQRASILRALLMKPQLLLADEPTSALDNIVQLEVMKQLLHVLKSAGILLITHDESLASWCSDRIIRLNK